MKLEQGDHIIFSSKTIPAPLNIANREELEKKLKARGARIFSDIHVSGHASREDLRDMIDILQPKHIIPTHGDLDKTTNLASLATEMGYKLGKDVHLLQNKQSVVV